MTIITTTRQKQSDLKDKAFEIYLTLLAEHKQMELYSHILALRDQIGLEDAYVFGEDMSSLVREAYICAEAFEGYDKTQETMVLTQDHLDV